MIKMSYSKEEKSKRVIRAIKTVFFLITLLISFLFFSAPVLIALADTILPSALLSASLSNYNNINNNININDYDFRYSLIDIPLISILRSIVIICVYSCCDGPKLSSGPYLWVTTMCSVLSLVFVSLKAPFIFGGASGRGSGSASATEVALFVCSYVLAVGHVFVAYRTSCRERKKLLVYKIDIEAVSSACKKGLIYEQMLKEQRNK
ncbi:hypothetical protein RND81_10G147200 [Saponaria officinalis]|uniref:MENTAL domain-containing protein n=1 Tax=Saponaria officinalis TaxID=3572 RepID=A0AAW1I4J9_SAPOF